LIGWRLNYARLTTDALSRIGLVLATTAILAGLAVWTWADFADAYGDAQAKTSAAAVAVDELASRSLMAIDVVLETVVARVAEQGLDKLRSEPERERLRRMASRLPETGALFVVDKVGDVIADTASYPFAVNVSDREWFSILRDGKEEVYVGRALKGRSVHSLFFPVARSIRGLDGTFIGAAQVGIAVTYIAHLFRDLDVGFGAHLGLYGARDGAVVARYPMTETLLDESVAALPPFSQLTKSQTQSWTGWTRERGQEHFVSARRLKGWPLIVTASLPRHAVYAAAWTRLLWRTGVAAMTITGLFLLTVLAVRQARREALLMGELEHRVKNMLALVAAVIERAREDSASNEDFVSSLRGRIKSMADAQDLLSQSQWRGVSLADLVRAELKPYATGANTQVDGPVVHLTTDATHGVAMVIHELATNAVKYGALSRPGGRVSVRWTLTTEQSPTMKLRIQWDEAGGPEVAMPDRQGFGSSVIRDLIAYELGGRVDLKFAPHGVRCMIELPAQCVL
jgi:two-component sensor histidine kinase